MVSSRSPRCQGHHGRFECRGHRGPQIGFLSRKRISQTQIGFLSHKRRCRAVLPAPKGTRRWASIPAGVPHGSLDPVARDKAPAARRSSPRKTLLGPRRSDRLNNRERPIPQEPSVPLPSPKSLFEEWEADTSPGCHSPLSPPSPAGLFLARICRRDPHAPPRTRETPRLDHAQMPFAAV